MIIVNINGSTFLFNKKFSILDACTYVGITIPRFCYHESLSIAGNCRLCLVEIATIPKLVSACTYPIENNMKIFTNTPKVLKARENILEVLLLNHPLDCPICDQGGECDLQDQAKLFGRLSSKNFLNRRIVENKNFDPFIKTIMTRCIHCTRCVRFSSEVMGINNLGTLNRGRSTEIGNYIENLAFSELSGNVIDLCPVGALTARSYAFQMRPWELKSTESIDITDSLGSNIYVNVKNLEIVNILPKYNTNINGNYISNKARFCYDANQNLRLYKYYNFLGNKQKTSKILTSYDFFKKINIKAEEKILFLINEDIELKTLNLLKNLENKFFNIIIKKIEKSNTFSNLYIYGLKNKINIFEKKFHLCLLMASNIRIENSILNYKLRSKYSNENIKIFSFGNHFQNTYSIQFINLKSNNIIQMLEGKYKYFSKMIFNYNVLYIFGESFFQRFYNYLSFINLLNNINSNSNYIVINKKSNTESFNYFNINSITTKNIQNVTKIIYCNIDDNLTLRNILIKNKKTNIWLNSHGSSIMLNQCQYAGPILTFFEQESVYINLEQRPQKALQVIDKGLEILSLYEVIKNIFLFTLNNSKHIKFIEEIVNNSKLFNTLHFYSLLILNKCLTSNFLYLKYPFKKVFSDFYLTHNYTLYSNILAKQSLIIKKNNINF